MAKCLTDGCDNEARQKFCSYACSKRYHNSRRPKARKVPIRCAGCGLVFEGRPDQKACSSTCRSRIERGTVKVRVKAPKRVLKSGISLDEIDNNLSRKNVPKKAE